VTNRSNDQRQGVERGDNYEGRFQGYEIKSAISAAKGTAAECDAKVMLACET